MERIELGIKTTYPVPRTARTTHPFLLAAFLAAFLSGCAVQVSEIETRASYDAEADALELVVVYRGVDVSKKDDEKTLADAKAIAERVLAGRREFIAEPWIGYHDVDGFAEKLAEPLEGEDAADPEVKKHREEARAVIDGFRLEKVEAFLDEEGRASTYQSFRLANVTRALALFNRHLSAELLVAMREETFVEDTPLLDDHTRGLWREHAGKGRPWIALAGGDVELTVPMSAASRDRLQRWLIDHLLADDEGANTVRVAQLLAHLDSLEYEDERLRLRFRPAADGAFHFRVPQGSAYTPTLLEAVRRGGEVKIAPEPPAAARKPSVE